MLFRSMRSFARAPMLTRPFAAVQRPFRVLGLQQIALGNLSKDNLQNFWGDILGATKCHSFVSEKENVDEDVFEIGKGLAKVEVDLMAPIDPEKSPKVHIPPLNHIGIWIDDLPNCVKFLEGIYIYIY